MVPKEPRIQGDRGPEEGLRRRIVAALLLAALAPLGLTSVGAWVVYDRLLRSRALDVHATAVTGRAATIELYFAERLRALELAAATHGLEELSEPTALEQLFARLNATHDGAFVDLGVIDSSGRHVAYVGPYDLRGRDYSEAPWFRDVSRRGSYVSDVFLGFREVPHCVVAVRRQEGRGWWVLRATLDSDRLEALVRTGHLGETGDAFLLGAEGAYQTPPRVGRVLERAPFPMPGPHRGVRHETIEATDGTRRLLATAWLGQPRWLLVVVQDEAEVLAPVRQAMVPGALVVALSVLVLVVTTLVATRHLTNRLREATRQRDEMSRDLLRSAKLASLGELATGLAHEINNPLGIISAEKTNIGDLVSLMEPHADDHDEILESVARIGRQVQRCAAITGKMLRFGRHGGGEIQLTQVGPRLEEITALLQKQAQVRNVELRLELEEDLPPVRLDPTELEQVVVNLVTNSFQAIKGEGHVTVSASRGRKDLIIGVEDDGVGIEPDDLGRIFQPFFTTKAVGEGTGLGLSVCYGIVAGWGGQIEADSIPGLGTRIVIRLPLDSRTGEGAKTQGETT